MGQLIVTQAPPLPEGPPPASSEPAGALSSTAIAGLISDAAFQAALDQMCTDRLTEVQRQCQELLAKAEAAHEATLREITVARNQFSQDTTRSTSNLASCQAHAANAQASSAEAAQHAAEAAKEHSNCCLKAEECFSTK